jgi:repressor LexA
MTDSDEPGPGAVLTWRKRRILSAIQEYAAVHGCSPTNREIAKAADLKSASSVLHHLQELKAAGYVSYEPGAPRTVRVLRSAGQGVQPPDTGGTPDAAGTPDTNGGQGTGKVAWVPLVGDISAGAGIHPLGSTEGYIPLPADVVGQEEGLFMLKVVGDSMTGVGIFPGDWVVVRTLFDKPKDGDIVAALLDGAEVDGTVKTYRKLDRRVWLMPQNSAYTPIPGDRADIRGKVVAVLRQVGQGMQAIRPLPRPPAAR